MALVTAGPPAVWSVKLLNTRAVAPASAPASAEVCACVRAVNKRPTSIASIDAAIKAMKPKPTKTNCIPLSSRRKCRIRFIMIRFLSWLLSLIAHLSRDGERDGGSHRRAVDNEVRDRIQHAERERVAHGDHR